MEGEKFLADHFDLHAHKETDRAVEHARHHEDKKVSDNKKDRIQTYLERIERLLDNPKASGRLEKMLTQDFILDTTDREMMTKLAKSMYESEKQIAINRGQTDEINRLERSELDIVKKYTEAIEEKQLAQKETLQSWINYLKSNDAGYPLWFRYYVIRSLKTMGNFERGPSPKYTNRTETTLAPFPELNAEALGFAYQALQKQVEIESTHLLQEELTDNKKHNRQKLQSKKQTIREEYVVELNFDEDRIEELSQELATRLESKNFGKLYSFGQVEAKGSLDRESLKGQWVKYPQGSDYRLLEEGLRGKGTGWCTASGSAAGQLRSGDFYVFFTQAQSGKFTEPRIAIRMSANKIAEVRGVNRDQELEPELINIAKQQYQELPGAEKYEKAEHDMKLMTSIYQKSFFTDMNGIQYPTYTALSKEEIRFLYEMDSKIESFGYKTDPRIAEALSHRDERSDLAFLLDLEPDQFSFNMEQFMNAKGKVIYHRGDLSLTPSQLERVKVLPKTVTGDLELNDLESLGNWKLPENLQGNLYLNNLESAKGLVLPKNLKGKVYLSGLGSVAGLNIPTSSIGILDLNSNTRPSKYPPEKTRSSLNLEKIKIDNGLKFNKTYVGDIYLGNIQSPEGLQLPTTLNGSLYLNSLNSLDGLVLPTTITGSLSLNRLRRMNNVILPKTITKGISLKSLETAQGLVLPDKFKGDLNLDGLTNAAGLNLPPDKIGALSLRGLRSHEGLNLPETIDGDLDLSGLRRADGLKFPKRVNGNINLGGLASAKGLVLDGNITGSLDLSALKSVDGITISGKVGGLINLTSTPTEELRQIREYYSDFEFRG